MSKIVFAFNELSFNTRTKIVSRAAKDNHLKKYKAALILAYLNPDVSTASESGKIIFIEMFSKIVEEYIQKAQRYGKDFS